MQTLMEPVYIWGVSVIQDLQNQFSEYGQFMETVSHISDPAYAVSIIFPIISTVDSLLAADILLVSALAEWSNTILKWILREDRPYWWVRETGALTSTYLYVEQTPITCETGPGSPSGHVMGCSALLYCLINACVKKYSIRTRGSSKTYGCRGRFTETPEGREMSMSYYVAREPKDDIFLKFSCQVMKAIFWSIYLAVIFIVSISRMFVATHFPHQCMLGAVLGFMIGHFFGNSSSNITKSWHNSTKLKFLIWVFCGTVISFAAYWIQKALGIDPQWSVKLAFKWCENIEYVHVNTTPLFSLVRDSGLGLGLISITPVLQTVTNKQNMMISVACVLVYCTSLHLAQISVPSFNATLFYVCHALLFSTMPYVLINIIPNVATVKQLKTKSS